MLLLRSYDRILLQEMKFNRQNLLERDDFRCQYCGKTFAPKELNMDHVLPKDKGAGHLGKMWSPHVSSATARKVTACQERQA